MLPHSDERFDSIPTGRSDRSDTRAHVVAQLIAAPLDDQALRNSIWTYAGNVRQGMSAGRVIRSLTRLVDAAALAPPAVHRETMRKVMLWCVEAYFGQLGGDVTPYRDAPVTSASQARQVTQ